MHLIQSTWKCIISIESATLYYTEMNVLATILHNAQNTTEFERPWHCFAVNFHKCSAFTERKYCVITIWLHCNAIYKSFYCNLNICFPLMSHHTFWNDCSVPLNCELLLSFPPHKNQTFGVAVFGSFCYLMESLNVVITFKLQSSQVLCNDAYVTFWITEWVFYLLSVCVDIKRWKDQETI